MLAVNIWRIFHVSITCDETASYATNTYLEVMVNDFGSTNNHILHSLLRKFFTETFNDHLFFLRVDSLLAQIAYIVFSYRLSGLLFGNRWWQLGCFLVLNTASPLLFEFWGLSRGYGLATAFLCVSTYYLLQYEASQKLKFLVFSMGAAILAAYSNYSLANYCVALAATMISCRILFSTGATRWHILRELTVILTTTVIFIALILPPLRHTVNSGDMSALGNDGFIADTLRSLAVDAILFSNPPDSHHLADILVYTAIAATCVICAYWSVRYIKERSAADSSMSDETRQGVILLLLLVLSVISVLVLHVLFGIAYLKDRTALFFVFMFILALAVTLYHSSRYSRAIIGTMSMILTLACLYNFLRNISFNDTRLWWYNMNDVSVLRDIVNEQRDKTKKVRLWVGGTHVPSFKYNIEHYFKNSFEPVREGPPLGIDTTFDYYYVSMYEDRKLLVSYVEVKTYVNGGMFLYRKKYR